MMQDGNKSRSKCGVMLALALCDRLCAAAGDESSVGRSVGRFAFLAGGSHQTFFPSPFPP